MALVLRSIGAGTPAASALTLSIPKPAGLAVGDLMIAYALFNANGGATLMTAPDATWLLVDYEHRANVTHGIFYKLATSTDVAASSFSPFTSAVAGANVGQIYAFSSGYDPLYPVMWDIGGSTNAAGTNSWTGITGFFQTNAYVCGAISGSTTGMLPVTAVAIATDDPGGWTDQGEFGNTTSVARGSLWTSNQRSQITDTGNLSATPASTSRANAGSVFAILPSQTTTNFSDYYPEGEAGVMFILSATGVDRRGQAFVGNGNTLASTKVPIQKVLAPTGNVFMKIYASTGTFGSTMIPTGAALATSDAVDVSTLPTTNFPLQTFTFSGGNQITLTNGVDYCVSLECVGIGDGSNYVRYLGDSAGYLLHPGNGFVGSAGGSFASSSTDYTFYVITTLASRTPRNPGINFQNPGVM